MNQICKTKKSGFSLVETLIAIFVFSLAATMVVGTFSGLLKNYIVIKKSQKTIESAQYVMNLMAKTIRSSTLLSITSTPAQITVFDDSKNTCIRYNYSAGTLNKLTKGPTVITNCGSLSGYTAPVPLTTIGEILGVNFIGVASATGTSVGKVTMSINIAGGGSSRLQTTVSLR